MNFVIFSVSRLEDQTYRRRKKSLIMPEELHSTDEFMSLAPLASKCIVKRLRNEETVKLKLRTKKRLYTYKTTPEEAQDLISRLRIEVEEV